MNQKEKFKVILPYCVFLLIIIITSSCKNKRASITNPNTDIEPDIVNIDLSQYASSKHLINPNKLILWKKDNTIDLVIIDVRKKAEYAKGHIKDAVNIWRPEIRSKNYPYSGMTIEKDSLQNLMQRLGANEKSKIVIYDAKGNPDAARLWWMLAIYGYDDVYLLNGGISNIGPEQITKETTTTTMGNFVFHEKENKALSYNKTQVLAAINDTNTILLDCRSKDEFTGKVMKKGAFRSGHIPMAINIDYSEAIAYERFQTFRDRTDLEQRFKTLSKDKKIIIYCQSGVRSALMTFVLKELLGCASVSNYDGSWIEWSYYKKLPIETGIEDTPLL